jgi:outer membrane protein assembly factor BamB
MTLNRLQTIVLAVFTLAFAVSTARADWPEFRGPTADGHVSVPAGGKAPGLPLEWSETKNVQWKTEIPDRGWSTPVIMAGQVWLTTAAKDGHDFYAICIDEKTGQVLYNIPLFHSDSPEPLGNAVNCYAACSPAIEPGRVYVHFGSYGTACLDTASGHIVWKREDLPCRHWRGPSSSVVLFENLVILTFDGADLQYVAALDKATGQTVWKTDRDVVWNDDNITGEFAKYADMAKVGDFRKAHSTPLVVTGPDGKPQLLSGGAKAAFGYNPRTGKEIWRVHYDDWSVAPRPLYQDGTAYLVTGLMHPQLWAVRIDGEGDVTDSHVTWRLTQHVPKTASPILVEGLIYMLGDDGIATAADASTGDIVWTKRIGGKFAGSPIYGDGKLYFCNQGGDTTVVKPGREYEALATNTLEDGLMASPAADSRSLYLRTKTHLYRIESTSD